MIQDLTHLSRFGAPNGQDGLDPSKSLHFAGARMYKFPARLNLFVRIATIALQIRVITRLH